MGRKSLAALAVSAVMMLAACSGGDDESPGGGGEAGGGETWAGEVTYGGNSGQWQIGTWEGPPEAIKVECSGSEGTVTATLTAPEGWTATTTQPEGGGGAAVTITDEGGESVTIEPQGSYEVLWGATATFSVDWRMKDEDRGWAFGEGDVTCEQG